MLFRFATMATIKVVKFFGKELLCHSAISAMRISAQKRKGSEKSIWSSLFQK
jgi:hypothetical protein